MPRPQPMSLNDFINDHREHFVRFELWISDELTKTFVKKFGLEPAYAWVVSDLDQDEPLGKIKDKALYLRINGRFFIPKQDGKGNPLKLAASKWIEAAKEWFDDNEVVATIDEESQELIKFTAFIDALSIPDDVEEIKEESAPASDDQGGGDDGEAQEDGNEGSEDPQENQVSDEDETPREDEKGGDEAAEDDQEEEDPELEDFAKEVGL